MQHKTKIILCLDEDAIKDTEKLYNLLSSVDIDVWFVEIPNDVAFFYQKIGKEKSIELIKRNTRRYAKRQLTWFRADNEIAWFENKDQKNIIDFLKLKIKGG